MFSTSAPSDSTEATQMSDAPTVIRQCRFFKRDGKCRQGDHCTFSHDINTSHHQTVKSDQNEGEVAAVVKPDTDSTPSPDTVAEHSNDETPPPPVNKTSTSSSANKVDKHHPKKIDAICRYYANKGKCWSGDRCRFLHEKPAVVSISNADDTQKQVADDVKEGKLPGEGQQEKKQPKKDVKVERKKKPARVCRFFKAGNCKKGAECQFRHPGFANKETNGSDHHASTNPDESSKASADNKPRKDPVASPRREPMQRPSVIPMSLKIADLTEDKAKELRQTEITQLKKRFLEAKLEEDEQPETYRITVNPTDPDWPFEVRDFEIWVSFPDSYPAVPFIVDMPEDQVLPDTVLDYMVPQMQEWVSAKHGTNQVSGKVDLIFRPFLRWLDRKLETLFTQAARKFKRQVDAKAAGFEFVAFQQIDKPLEEKRYEIPNVPPPPSENDSGISDSTTSADHNGSEDPVPPSTANSLQSNMSNLASADTNRRGTEILFRNLQLGDGIGTLICHKLCITIQCGRCKNRCEITTPARRANLVPCTKCQHRQQVIFRPSLVHKFSPVVGFLDLEGCIQFDLVLMECEFAIGCINCPKEMKMPLIYGHTETMHCEGCHQKMTISVDSTRFHKLVPSQPIDSTNAHLITLKSTKKPVNHPAIQEGQPLPDTGTCPHYKKSFRWLRFPCCGKTYPCDMCHDENEGDDHEMKYAVRMICGHCCKEQPFTNEKPCISCGSMTTKGKSTHWEGGKGCRNKIKMDKNDSKKHSNSNKTVSRKAQRQEDEKAGKHKKSDK